MVATERGKTALELAASEQLPESVRAPKMKVLVESAYAEVTALTFRKWVVTYDSTGKEEVQLVSFFRQFHRFKATHSRGSDRGLIYMSPEEATFLVESWENQQNTNAGVAGYWYPNGVATPVPVDQDVKIYGPYTPPVPHDQTGMIDPRAAEGAQRIRDERDEAIAAARAAREAAGK